MLDAQPAIVPPMPWLSRHSLEQPFIEVGEGMFGKELSLSAGSRVNPLKWIIRVRYRARWYMYLEPGELEAFPIEQHFGTRDVDEIIVSYVDRIGAESPTATYRREIEPRKPIGF